MKTVGNEWVYADLQGDQMVRDSGSNVYIKFSAHILRLKPENNRVDAVNRLLF